jgi:DNA primase
MDQVTEEIRQRADIVDVVGQYVALRPAGNGRWKACCPFHDEKTPSFNVSRDKGFYKCFGCGAAGDVFRFVQQIENLTFPEARRQLAERYGVTVPTGRELTPEQQAAYSERDRLVKITAASAAYFREQFTGNAGLAARDYARSRGLSAATLEKFGIGYAPDAWDSLYYHLVNRYGFTPEDAANAGLLIERNDEGPAGHARTRYYDRYRHRLMFPIWDERGQVIAFGGRALEGGSAGNADAKYINSPEGPLFKKSRVLYAFHLARPEVTKRESLIITEGYMDAIALHEAGFGNTVATLGTALTTQHVALLRRIAPKIIYLCFDGDSAGMRAALRAAPLFAAHQLDVRVVSLPKEDDPDTFIRKHGEAGFENALRSARLLSQYRVEMAMEGHDLGDISSRKEAIRAAAEVIAEVPNDIEKATYISWVAEQWARAEGITSTGRLQMVEAAVRRDVNAVAKRWQLRDRQAASQQQQQSPGADSEDISETLSGAAVGLMNGGLRAERALLGAMLGGPTWRPRIVQALPVERWTQPAHREIVAALQEDLELINPATIIDDLSEEAAGLVADIMLSDDAVAPPSTAVIDDMIRIVNYHRDLKTTRELYEALQQKQQDGEAISTDELRAYQDARKQLDAFRSRTAVPR